MAGLARQATDEQIKQAYRQLAKKFHPDVFNRSEELAEGETAESRFIQIQAAYELLMDDDQRRQYDSDHRANPMQASRAWVEWIAKKKKAFEQRGELAASVWAEQQQREMNLRARQRAKAKMDPEEEKRILARERQASMEMFETTLKRHNLVLRKRDLVRKQSEDAAKKQLVQDLLALEGFELDDEST